MGCEFQNQLIDALHESRWIFKLAAFRQHRLVEQQMGQIVELVVSASPLSRRTNGCVG